MMCRKPHLGVALKMSPPQYSGTLAPPFFLNILISFFSLVITPHQPHT